ncbi:MAG: heparinase II/III-family protein [Flavobacteriaceae bacterium]|nr:heparinase II/III-family protein [Flavobacteriaceae bacterium]
MRTFYSFFLFLISLILINCNGEAVEKNKKSVAEISNPFTPEYLTKNLRKESPRLVLNAEIDKILRNKLNSDPVVQNIYQTIKLNADQVLQKPFLERIKIGKRLLSVSREMLYRINMLGMVYYIEKDPKILERIDGEVKAVCQFSDWNPSHYLDVGEMSMAVAFALDWTTGDLPESTIELALNALIEKGIKPSYNKESRSNTWWINGNNNWNQVCNGGMIAASIAIAERDPELAATTIRRSIDGFPHALDEYGPDGVYPEGSTYWGYGTVFSVVTNAMLESAFGTDFGLGNYPAFKESAIFRVLMNTPSGWYYNFADCGDKRSENGDITLAWFASKSGDELFFERNRLLRSPSEIGKLRRLDGAGLVWLAQYEKKLYSDLPSAWKGEGSNPVAVFTGGSSDPYGYYFGGKGGSGTVNHGNMDAGSFIFELNGIRWVFDPGNQNYNDLEKEGFDLWNKSQDSQRWTLLNKGNFGHSTLSVNDQLHIVDGKATIADFKEGENPQVTFDLTPTFKGQLKSAERTFTKDSNVSLVIEDKIEIDEMTEIVTWQLITTLDVEITPEGATIYKSEYSSVTPVKKLYVENISHPKIQMNVVSLDPPPLALDRRVKGLKRIELKIPSSNIEGKNLNIKVRLRGQKNWREGY